MNKTIDKLLYIQIFLIRAIFNGLKFLEKKEYKEKNQLSQEHQNDEKMERRSQRKKESNNKIWQIEKQDSILTNERRIAETKTQVYWYL